MAGKYRVHMPVTITLQKGVDYHEVEGKAARAEAPAKEASGSGAERVTRLEDAESIFSLSFADIEARIVAALHDKITRKPRRGS